MRKRNWKKYNKQLIQRGNLTFLIDPKLFKNVNTKSMGRPQIFSDSLILMLMMTKIHYRLAYRTLQGFAESLMSLIKQSLPIPTYSLICKRARKLNIPKLSSKKPSIVAIDASGVKIYGEGEWRVKIHGKSKRRKWIKIHMAIDLKTGEVMAEATTNSEVHDGKQIKTLLNETPRSLKQVLADGAYDGKCCRNEISRRGAKALIPPPKTARIHNKDYDRDDAIRVIQGLGGDKEARSIWGKLTGYSQRSLIETTFSRMKRLFGDRLFSKRFDSQSIENRLRCLLLNKMNCLTG